ncbi:DNA translocase FtsK [Solirhodobacter olei]|uniref:DNA translocase FtsK n=1 Tax=Solirhodobacter olei TaxID=2493082 RepID=UPI000FDB066C|nr:DNA translocase FtsK [Solirhodobacter olei]
MASYQMRQRDPLLDQDTQALLERRGKELIGLALLALGVLAVILLGSYAPGDPGWMSDTHAPTKNLLGTLGATVASPLVVIAGMGAWGVPVALLTWGARLVTHRGEDRAMNRVIFAPIAVALTSIFASTYTPAADWGHAFGLGGLFGDTVLGTLIGMLPFGVGLSLKLLSVLVGAGFIGMSLFVLGFDLAELGVVGRFLLVGTIRTYDMILRMTRHGAAGSYRAAQAGAVGSVKAAAAIRDRQAARREAEMMDAALGRGEEDGYGRPEPLIARRHAVPMAEAPAYAAAPAPAPAPQPARGSFLSRMSPLKRRPAPEPEQVAPTFAEDEWSDAPSEDRIRARIAHAISARGRPAPAPVEPTAPRFRGPKPLVLSPAPAAAAARMEPPVMGRGGPGTGLPPQPRVTAGEAPAQPTLFAEEPADEMLEPLDPYDVDPDYEETPRFLPSQAEPRRVVQAPAAKPAQPSRQARAEAQPALRFDAPEGIAYEAPPLNLLTNPADVTRHYLSQEALEENARMLESVLDDYGVKGEIVSVRPGPVVTQYELEPAPGLKASRVIGLADDIARSMSALSARVSTVPGRSVIGIELPNASREKVVLREILAARDFGDSHMKLPLALGKDIGGDPVVANLAKMPHLLIAGTTGSGKSVAINTMILSLLYKLSPEECRLIMIDPKMLELSVYDGIPHLLSPVVTDPKKAVVALKWVVGEMEERYRKMSKMGVRNIEGFNGRVREALAKGEMFKRTIQTGFDEDTGDPVFETEEFEPKSIPYIVVIVDEMADLMMVAGKEIEACIQRLAQMARASGIHLIMATQRPSVDVITGTIKANFPTRISFQVTSKIDSRTILGEQGAEQLLGMGDMLYMAGGARITRIHGPFVSDEEVEEIVTHLKSFGPPEYMSGVVDGPEDDKADDIDLVLGLGGNTDGEDALYDQAVQVVLKDRKCSTSYIQRKLGIGYNKAARLVEQMEEQGLVTPANHVGKREILVPEQ